MVTVGIIGYGRQTKRIVDILLERDESCRIGAITDPRREEIIRDMQAEGKDPSSIRFYDDPEEMLKAGNIDGVFIGTRCSQHARLARLVLQYGYPLHLEKPVATNMADLLALRDAYRQYGGRVIVSFPLRVTKHVQLVKEVVDSGKIGTVEHVQAVNNVGYGGIYFHNWYRDENETQGLFIQKATHDFDYINYVLGIRPTAICAMTSKQIFKGDKPAGLACEDCTEWETCPESPRVLQRYAFETPQGNLCCFARDTGNEDSGTAIIRYESGMHAVYSQNFFVRKGAAKRGARFMGYKGTVEFDWSTNVVQVFMHHSPVVERYELDTAAMSAGHGGGDYALVDNFIDMLHGRTTESLSPLDAGLQSILMSLQAKLSAQTGTFRSLGWPDTK